MLNNNSIGNFVKKERLKNNISVRQLALQADVSASYISRLENGKNKNMVKPATISKLAKGLRLDEKDVLARFNVAEFNDNNANQILTLPLLKNPLLVSDLEDGKNLIKQLSFLKTQVAPESRFVIEYDSDDMKSMVPKGSSVVLSKSKDKLKPDQLVAVKDKVNFRIGKLKKYDKDLFAVNDNYDIIPIKRNTFSVTLIFKR